MTKQHAKLPRMQSLRDVKIEPCSQLIDIINKIKIGILMVQKK